MIKKQIKPRKLTKSEKGVLRLLKKIEILSKEPDYDCEIFPQANNHIMLLTNPTDEERIIENKMEYTLARRIVGEISTCSDGGDPNWESDTYPYID